AVWHEQFGRRGGAPERDETACLRLARDLGGQVRLANPNFALNHHDLSNAGCRLGQTLPENIHDSLPADESSGGKRANGWGKCRGRGRKSLDRLGEATGQEIA